MDLPTLDITYKRNYAISYLTWLASLGTLFSRLICVAVYISTAFFVFFYNCWMVFHCMNIPHFVYLFFGELVGIWGASTFLAIMNNATMNNILVQVFVHIVICINIYLHFSWLNSKVFIQDFPPWSGNTGSCGNSTFNSLRNCQTVFQRSFTIFTSYQQCVWIPISLFLHSLTLNFFIVAP